MLFAVIPEWLGVLPLCAGHVVGRLCDCEINRCFQTLVVFRFLYDKGGFIVTRLGRYSCIVIRCSVICRAGIFHRNLAGFSFTHRLVCGFTVSPTADRRIDRPFIFRTSDLKLQSNLCIICSAPLIVCGILQFQNNVVITVLPNTRTAFIFNNSVKIGICNVRCLQGACVRFACDSWLGNSNLLYLHKEGSVICIMVCRSSSIENCMYQARICEGRYFSAVWTFRLRAVGKCDRLIIDSDRICRNGRSQRFAGICQRSDLLHFNISKICGIDREYQIFSAFKIALAGYGTGISICVCKPSFIPRKGVIRTFYKCTKTVKNNRNRRVICCSSVGAACGVKGHGNTGNVRFIDFKGGRQLFAFNRHLCGGSTCI